MNTHITVMLVDDEPIVRDCITAYLEDEGFTVLNAASAEAALEQLACVRTHVCITDLRLPGMSGEELAVTATRISPSTRFLIHTGSDYHISDELAAIGMNQEDVLLKPVHNLGRLTETIIRAASARYSR